MKIATQKTLLLVEDEAIVAAAEKIELEEYGYTVRIAASGEEAVAAVDSSRNVDLILMDINLGSGIDGTQAAEIILKNHDIPILFVSSHHEREIVERTEKISSYGYVVKNSSATVFDASIKMAFKLFYSHKKISESEARYKYLADNIPDIIYSLDGEGRIKTINSASFGRYGYDSETSSGKPFLDFIHPDDQETVIRSFASAIREQRTQTTGLTFRLLTDGGEARWLELNAHAHFDAKGAYIGEEGLLRDITDRKKTEVIQRESEEKYSKIFEGSPFPLMLIDTLDGSFSEVNEALIRNLEYSREELIGNSAINLGILDPGTILESKRLMAETGQFSDFEISVRTKSGAIRVGTATGQVIRISDHPYLLQTITDITDRKNAETMLNKEKERLQLVLSETNTGTWEWNIQTGEAIIDEASARLLGYHIDDFKPLTLESWMLLKHPDDAKTSTELLMKHVRGEMDFYSFESRMLHKIDGWIWIHGRGKIIEWDAEGNPLRMFGTHIDITERKLTEEALQASEAKYRQLYESIMDAIVLIDMDGMILYSNAVFQKMLGYSPCELSTLNNRNLTSEESLEMEKELYAGQILERGFSDIYEKEYVRKDGSLCPVEIRYFLLKDKENNPSSMWAIVRDITERKHAEEKIQALLAEKELILKEVHHRIKNNMSTIGSLLSLQAQSMIEPSAISALEDAKNRVQSTMVLYDRLYHSSNFTAISAKDYLSSLIDDIVANFPNAHRIKLEKNIQDFTLDAKRLQAIGIIINELITNIMKYAFTGIDTGTISMSATNVDGHITIGIHDDGNGMPLSLTFENSPGFGLMLIKVLTEQLEGSVRIEREKGTKIVLEFEK